MTVTCKATGCTSVAEPGSEMRGWVVMIEENPPIGIGHQFCAKCAPVVLDLLEERGWLKQRIDWEKQHGARH